MSKKSRKAIDKGSDDYAHRHCVSVGWMKLSYSQSYDYDLCDEDGQFNPTGDFYQSRRTGEIRRIQGQCSLQFLENGKLNPKWEGCPFGNSKNYVLPEPTLENLEELLEEEGLVKEEPVLIVSTELEGSIARLEALLKGKK